MGARSRWLVEREDGLKLLSPSYARAFLGLLRAAEVVDRGLDADLRSGYGISLRAYEVLLYLGALSPAGSVRMSQLAEQAPLSQSQVSRIVAELEAKGYLSRSRFEEDTRGVIVSITDAGRALLRQAEATHLDGLSRLLFSRLQQADVDELTRLTRLILGDQAPKTGHERPRADRPR